MENMIGGVPGNVLGMLSDILLKLKSETLTAEELERFSKRQNPFPTPEGILGDWSKFFLKYFGREFDCADVRIPKAKKGFDRVIVVPRGLTMNEIWQVCKKHFKCWSYCEDDLDRAIPTHDRINTKSYAARFRDRREADEELKNLSANQLKEKNIPGITVPECFLYVLKYYDETSEHLDVHNWTLCSGSRGADGGVPGVYWDDSELYVDWYGVGDASGDLRSRAAVS